LLRLRLTLLNSSERPTKNSIEGAVMIIISSFWDIITI
jgi:hypothetical protein